MNAPFDVRNGVAGGVRESRPPALRSWLLTSLSVVAMTGLLSTFAASAGVANISMLYLLVVIFSALLFGSGQAIWASVFSFLLFNWFFTEPKYTLHVKDSSDLIALCVYLVTATVTGQLMALLKERAEEARKHQEEAERLLKAQTQARMLAETDKLKTALLSMISHDFRSPLTSIKASVSGLLQKGSPMDEETTRALLEAIDGETDRLNRLVGNILDLSRLEANAWRPKREETLVADIIGGALDSLSAAENKRVDVRLDPELAEICVDQVQFVQVLRNLLENALKYSPSGSRVEIRTRGAGACAVIEIIDSGRGLKEGEEKLIFQPFYRAPDLQESAIPGVGIGLAVCRGLIEAHGGELAAENRKGGGAVFRVVVPIESTENAAPAETPP